jgi:hypothetical protein
MTHKGVMGQKMCWAGCSVTAIMGYPVPFCGSEVMQMLDVHFINTLPVLVASRHSRESGNPGDERHGDWMPACAGMTFYWRRTYETDI